MTRPGIEPRSPRPLANTLTAGPLNFFFHLHLFDGVSIQYPQVFVGVLFSEHSNFVRYRLSPFITSMDIFLCQIRFLYPDCIFLLHLSEFPILFHFLQTVWCRPYSLGDWSFPAIYWVCIRLCIFFLCCWVAIINSNGDSASPWNIPFLIFASEKLFPPAVNSTLQVFMVFSIIIIIIIIISSSCSCRIIMIPEFCTLVLADGLSLESE